MFSNTRPILFIDFDGTLCHDRFWVTLSLDFNRKYRQSSLVLKKKRLILGA